MIEQSERKWFVVLNTFVIKIEVTIYPRLPTQEINGMLYIKRDMWIHISRANGKREIKYLSFFYG